MSNLYSLFILAGMFSLLLVLVFFGTICFLGIPYYIFQLFNGKGVKFGESTDNSITIAPEIIFIPFLRWRTTTNKSTSLTERLQLIFAGMILLVECLLAIYLFNMILPSFMESFKRLI